MDVLVYNGTRRTGQPAFIPVAVFCAACTATSPSTSALAPSGSVSDQACIHATTQYPLRLLSILSVVVKTDSQYASLNAAGFLSTKFAHASRPLPEAPLNVFPALIGYQGFVHVDSRVRTSHRRAWC